LDGSSPEQASPDWVTVLVYPGEQAKAQAVLAFLAMG